MKENHSLNILNKISLEDDSFFEKILILFISVSLPFTAIFYFFGFKYLSISVVLFNALFGFSLFLQKKAYTLLAKSILYLAGNTAICFYTINLGVSSGTMFIFIPFTIGCFFLFKRNELKTAIALSITSVSLFYATYQYSMKIGKGLFINPGKANSILFYPMTLVAYILGAGIILLFIDKVHRAMNALELQNQQLQSSLSELEKTNTLLKESQATNEKLAQQSAYARLVKGIAHEIRNPIAGMYTCAELVKEEPDDVEEVKRLCDAVIENLGRLNKLTNAMLKYGGTSTIDQKLFDSTPMIEGMISIAKAGFQKKGVALLTDLKGNSPIYANETFIHSAISNLLANALQYTDAGEVKISSEEISYVDLNGKIRDGIKISVSDSGTGISENDLNNIFDPYFTKKKSETNVGLGLSMAYKFVTESNGKIIVSSKLGEGTTFDVYLPSEA